MSTAQSLFYGLTCVGSRALISAMWEKAKRHWKLTTFLLVVSAVECAIIAFYFSIDFTRPSLPPGRQVNSYAVFGIVPGAALAPVEIKLPTFAGLFKEGSGIEKRLPKLLHDYFKETQPTAFSPRELVGLLNCDIAQMKQFTLRKESIVLHINPHNLTGDDGIKSVAIKKELLGGELKDIYKEGGSDVRVAKPDYEIAVQPKPGDTIDSGQKMIALTFDDGPDGNTHALLDALDKYEASATFFVLGQKVAGGAGVLQRMVREGHEIGNHSWNHPDLRNLSHQQLAWQIQATQDAIHTATGAAPTQMRPPYGATNPAIAAFLKSQNLTQALWSVDTNDWRDKDAEVLYNRILSSAGDGKVVLLHDIHATSVQAAIRAIPELKAQGYQLVTLSQRNAYR